jgi:PAS domain S-box-containing protein
MTGQKLEGGKKGRATKGSRKGTLIPKLSQNVLNEENLQEQALRNEQILQTAMDGFCVMDMEGNVLEVNDALCQLYGYSRQEMLGINIRDIATRSLDELLGHRAKLIRKGSDRYETKSRRNDGRIVDIEVSANFIDVGKGFIFAFVHDITKGNQNIFKLKEREKELAIKGKTLEDANIALRVLLKKRDEDRKELEDKVLSNIRESVLPHLESLKKSELNDRQKAYLGLMESNLNDILAAFAPGFSVTYLSLTPTEFRIAKHIKQGKSSKEIARLLNLSRRTVDSHRGNIREKFGIKKSKTNLRSYLLSIKS